MPPFVIFLLILEAVLAVLFVLYVFAVKPGPRRAEAARFMQGCYAHRGLHDENLPENSQAAFEAACRAGYDIELDVQLSRDGVPMVFHDATLTRVCGVDGKLSDYTAEELSKMPLCGKEAHTIPTFAEVLATVNGRVMLLVEIKGERNITHVCEGASALLDAYDGPFCVESFSPYVVRWFRENRPAWVRGQLSSHFFRDPRHRNANGFIMQSLFTNFLTKPDFIAFDHRYSRYFPFFLATRVLGGHSAAWTVKSLAQELACRGRFNCIIFEGYLPEKGKDA
ncbi:MAG: glycerophosphodiester phosphodiesterase [Clostridia bacterium]|nr:glycerophosphodiester phosphodiesterase [Clostridia bacterium]